MTGIRSPQNRLKNWNGTVHYANVDGNVACGTLSTHRGWLAPSVATVTCGRCIARFGADEPGHEDAPIPSPYDRPNAAANIARRAAERASRQAAREA